MSNVHTPTNIRLALDLRQYPTVVMWNRLEGRPRTHHFNKALKAEVRDALWMLTKQWQMGEFKADDAGSPVFAKVHLTSSKLNTYQAADKAEQAFENQIPLEVKAEQKHIAFEREGKEIQIDIRLQMGRYWLKMVQALSYRDTYTEKYTFELPARTRNTDYIHAHKDVWQHYAAISGRCMDGYKLYRYLSQPGHLASDGITATDPDKSTLDALGDRFKTWFETLYQQPLEPQNDAWIPNRLEYQFQCSAESDTDEKVLSATEYYHGHLDWYAFNINKQKEVPGAPEKATHTDSFIPAHVDFDGMPNTRWWKFEDGKTDLGDIKPSTTDLSKLLLMEFGLVFANDWFLFPYTLPVGSLANVEGLCVKNNFGEKIWILPTEAETGVNQPWSMFKMRSTQQDNTLFLAPAAPKVHEGNALEEILMMRDEMSNMVWGIESVISSPLGKGEKGNEAALRIRRFHETFVPAAAPALPYKANVSYQAMTSVPENWIPFVPVHKPGDTREIQLQRASQLRIIEGDPLEPVKIKPLTEILRTGLDETTPKAYYLHEEEVPRAGIRVTQAFQRTRWTNGEVFVWLGMKKKTGRGEGNSGLAFDQLKDVKPAV